MLSPTTMASSTTIPNTSRNAKVDKKLMETSTTGRKINAPTNETAIPTVTQSATVNRSVKSRIIMTRISPIHAASKMSDIRDW